MKSKTHVHLERLGLFLSEEQKIILVGEKLSSGRVKDVKKMKDVTNDFFYIVNHLMEMEKSRREKESKENEEKEGIKGTEAENGQAEQREERKSDVPEGPKATTSKRKSSSTKIVAKEGEKVSE